MERFFGGMAESRLAKKKFFAGEEQITALFLDPTAFVLQPYTFYITGLSMGYGFSDKFQLFSKIPNNFKGDINLSPRWVVYQKYRGAEKENVALHCSFYSNHDMIPEYSKYYDEPKIDTADEFDEDINLVKQIYDSKSKFFWEAGAVYSKRMPLSSGRGNWSMHTGFSTNSLLFEKPKSTFLDGTPANLSGGFTDSHFKAFRMFFGIDYDLTRRIKFISEIFYDEGNRYLSFGDTLQEYFEHGFVNSNSLGDRKNFDFDFGLTFSPNETLRIGMHFQQPFITIYWKFLDY